ncbi:MAG: DUF4921 family protein [Nocardioides sp.]
MVHRDGEWRRLLDLRPEQLDASVAEFRLVPNLFEIISYDYWVANHGFTASESARAGAAYLASGAGRAHLASLLRARRQAAGGDPAEVDALSADDLARETHRFFSGSHHLVIARRHYLDGAETDDQLASSGSLTPEEHEQYVALTIRAMRHLYDVNPAVVLVAAFQNWRRPAGASFDHLRSSSWASTSTAPTSRRSWPASSASRTSTSAGDRATRRSMGWSSRATSTPSPSRASATATRPWRCGRPCPAGHGSWAPTSCATSPTCCTRSTRRPAPTCPATRSGTTSRPASATTARCRWC